MQSPGMEPACGLLVRGNTSKREEEIENKGKEEGEGLIFGCEAKYLRFFPISGK